MCKAIVFPLYLTGALLTYAGSNAEQQWGCHHKWHDICDDDMVAKDRGFAAIMAVFPPGWFSTLFYTGFYHHGFSFQSYPENQGLR